MRGGRGSFNSLEAKYPPRGAWSVVKAKPMNNYMHQGYTSAKLRPCPVCGRQAVFEECQMRKTMPFEKAKYFIGFCPTCELRTESGTLKKAVIAWQEKRYTPDSWLHCHRPKLDTAGCALLCEAATASAYEDARFYAAEMLKAKADSEYFTSLKKDLDRLEVFFRTSPLAFALDPDAVISKIRKELFPELEPKDRLRIPLRLSELYKGKAVVVECMMKKNLRKQL